MGIISWPPFFLSLPMCSSWNLELQALRINIAVCLQPFQKLQEIEGAKVHPIKIMFLLLLQMLLVSRLGTTGQTAELQKKRRFPHLLPQDKDMLTESPISLEAKKGQEGIETETGLLKTHLLAEVENKREKRPELPRYLLTFKDSHVAQDLGDRTWTSTSPHPESTKNTPGHPHRKREAEMPFRKDAKKFWDLFMLKTKSRSDEIVLPIKTNEMYQETCSTVPFPQSIAHKNCENLAVQNNLCFGRCSSFHIPGPEDRLYTFCSHCLATKFSTKRLQMNCTGPVPVIKVVMIVEECKCEVQTMKDPEIGFLHSDLRANGYKHN